MTAYTTVVAVSGLDQVIRPATHVLLMCACEHKAWTAATDPRIKSGDGDGDEDGVGC
jgi:hypothetical protein